MRGLSLALALIAAPALAQGPARTHCAPSERAVFSCATGAKVASLCLAPRRTPATQGLAYRFGPLGKPEMNLPAVKPGVRPPEGRFESFANGGRTGFVRMNNGATSYVVWHAELRDGPARWTNEAGVVVETARGATRIACRGPVAGDLLDMDVMQGTLAGLDRPGRAEFLFP